MSSAASPALRTVQAAAFHARLRWVGAPLLLSGFALLMWALSDLLRGGSLATVFISLLGCGLGLASFGANHDTALALAIRGQEDEAARAALPEALLAEVREELEQDRADTLALRPAPRIALAMPAVALAVQVLVLWRLM